MNRPLIYNHLPSTTRTASITLLVTMLAGCSSFEQTYSPSHTSPPIKLTANTKGSSYKPSNRVTRNRQHRPSSMIKTVANIPAKTTATFSTPYTPARTTPPNRSISAFGEISAGVFTGQTVKPHSLNGEDNLTRVTYSPIGGDFDPDISPDGKYMVFSSTQHNTTADIYIKKVDGRAVTQLTSDPAQDVMPVFSPDGRRVAFASDRSGNWDLYIMSVNGGQPMQVTSDSGQELHPSWSPDGTKIVYSRLSNQSGRWEVWISSLEENGKQQFLGYGLFPEWSPDPDRPQIVFQRARERGSRLFGIWTIDYMNGEAINPTEIASSTTAALINPTWSPDASHIVFAAIHEPAGDFNKTSTSNSDLWMVGSDGLKKVSLTGGSFTCLMPVWSTDGRIYFVSNREGVDNIWSLGPERGLLAAAPTDIAAKGNTATANATTSFSPTFSGTSQTTETSTTDIHTTSESDAIATVNTEVPGSPEGE